MNAGKVREKVAALAEPLLEGYGLELVDLEYQTGRRARLLIYIDKPGGVTIGDCEAVSRELSDLLDLYDPIPHRYVLEVSSPGVERPLTKKEHFKRFRGEPVKIQLLQPMHGRRNFAGKLEDINGDMLVILTEEGAAVNIPLSSIARARLWYKKPEKDKKREDGRMKHGKS